MASVVLFKAGAFPVYAHLVVLWGGMLICLGIVHNTMAKLGYGKGSFWSFSALAVLLGFALSHLFYGLARWGFVGKDNRTASLLFFWEGHYMLYGGMLGCALAALLVSLLYKHSTWKLLDTIAPAGALMIAFVRLAQGLNGGGYGDYLEEDSAFARFPFAVYDTFYDAWAWALFFLAALLAILLSLWLSTRKSRFDGDRTLWMLGMYAAMQIVLESLRRDDFLRWGFVRISQVISAVLAGLVLIYYIVSRHKQRVWRNIFCLLLYTGMVAVCILLEFALEQRIAFLQGLSVPACYGLMTLACMVIMGCIGIARGKPEPENVYKNA